MNKLDKTMYYGANQTIMEMAKALNKQMTLTESILWNRLNNKKHSKSDLEDSTQLMNLLQIFTAMR